MSVDYSKEFLLDNDLGTLKLNFFGVKNSEVDASTLRLKIFAYDKNLKKIFGSELSIDKIREIYDYLGDISVVKHKTTTSGKFFEAKRDEKEFLDKINDLYGSRKIDFLKKILTLSDFENIFAGLKQESHKKAISILEKLINIDCDKNLNIITEVKNNEIFKDYVANQPEKIFNNWFKKNHWVFGVDYKIPKDISKISINSEIDLCFESMDGSINILELKRPKVDKFFCYDDSHKSYYPKSELSKALGQSLFYINELDKMKLVLESEHNVKIIKPKVKIIIGRTNNFTNEEFLALKVLNSNLNHIQIISYDYILECGIKIIEDYS